MYLYGVRIVSLSMDGKERLCLAQVRNYCYFCESESNVMCLMCTVQISNTLLKEYSYNEIHNRRVALGITCVQCTPVQVLIQYLKYIN